MTINWLLKESILAIHNMLIAEHGGDPGIRDDGLLESALARPINLASYENKASISQIAAEYAYGIAKNHPFMDGNKRTAFVACVVFLEINGQEFAASEEEAYLVMDGLAAGTVSLEDLVDWIAKNTKK